MLFRSWHVQRCLAGPLTGDVELAQGPAQVTDPRCAACGDRDRCAGPLSPRQVVATSPLPRSNQFDWVESAAGELELDDGRRFACTKPDEPELEAVRARGQLYLDVSDKPRLDDFAADLRLLEPLPDGRWRVGQQQPFANEEAQLLAWLTELQGEVVDVGAGPIRYLQALRTAIQAGRLRYTAVEPDPAALERTAEALPEATLVRGVGEALPLADACADSVLLLRSVNHLRDLRQGLREALRVLRPGGTLVLVDNVAFGLLRTPAQLERAHAISVSDTPFEHYRNDDATDVAHVLAELGGVRLEDCHAVRPGGSNQWLLRARRL